MEVEIVDFTETKVAVIEHEGSPETEGLSIKKLIDWRKEKGYLPSPNHRNYGLHYNNHRVVSPERYRVDLCISVEKEIEENSYGVINKVIPACRCAKATHIGSREHVLAAEYLYEKWLPESGEVASELPIIFYYVNVGPNIESHEMITDVYLPLI